MSSNTPVLSAAQRLQLAHEQAQASASSQAPIDTEDPFPPFASSTSTSTSSASTSTVDPFPVSALEPPSNAQAKQQKRQTRQVDVSDESAFPSLGGGSTVGTSSPSSLWGTGLAKVKQQQPPAAPLSSNANANGAHAGPASTQTQSDVSTLTFTLPTSSIHISAPAPTSFSSSRPFSNDPRLKAGPPTTLGQVIRLVQQNHANDQVTVEASSSSKLTSFIIRAKGPKSEAMVEKVRKEVVGWLEKKVKDEVKVPKGLRAVIIGAKGRTLKQITESTGCQIQIPRDDELEQDDASAENGVEEGDDASLGPLISISLTGSQSAVDDARRQIVAIVRERTSKTTVELGSDVVPSEFWVFLNGVKGARMDQLVRKALEGTGEEEGDKVQVFVPRKTVGKRGVDVDDESLDGEFSAASTGDGSGLASVGRKEEQEKKIKVVGDKDLVRKVIDVIEAEVAELRSTVRPVMFSLPKRQHRFLIGAQAADRILSETGCAVEVPAAENPSEDVVVRGPGRETVKAMQLVMDLASAAPVEQLDLLTAHRGTHDPRQYARSLARYLLVKSKLRPIAQASGTKIYLPRPDQITGQSANAYLEIVGDAEGSGVQGVAQARGSVIAQVRRLPPTVFDVVEIDQLVHRHLIGKRGNKVKQLEKDHQVEVVFPKEGDGDEVLVVYVGEDATGAKAALDEVKGALASLAADFADLVTVTLSIPTALHGAVIGTGGTTLNAVLGEEKLVHVQFGSDKDKDEVLVRGPKDEAERVKGELERIAEEAKNEEIVNSHVVEFEIETALVRHVVGKSGSGVNKLREDLGVRVDFTELSTVNKKGGKMSKVLIKGRKENAEEAARRVKSTASKMADEVTLTIPLPVSLDRGSLIGKQGTYLRRLEEKYEVRINFPPSKTATPTTDEEPSSNTSDIVIRGPSKGAQAAKGELVDLISYEREHGNTVSFSVPVKALPRILGRGGAQVNQIKDDTGVASVDVDQADADDVEATISLKGTKGAIKKARDEIERIAKEVSDESRIEFDVPKEYHTTLIGSGGSSIRDLIARCGGPTDGRASGNMVRFPRQGDPSNTVTITAPSAIASKIKAALDKEIEALASRVVWGVVVPQPNHAAVIGKGASALQELQRKHGVKVYMPGWNDYAQAGDVENGDEEEVAGAEEKDVVKVVGPKDSVLAAATDLKAVKGRGGQARGNGSGENGQSSADRHTVKVRVPKHLHATVAQGGRFFRSLPNGIRVSHEGVKPPSSTLKSKKPPVSSSNGASRIDDDQEDVGSSDSIKFQLVPLHDGAENASADGEDDTIPWVVESRNEDDAEKVAEEIRKSLERAKEATHVGWVTVPRGLMPRIVGRGGSGLDRLRAAGVEVEVVGKRDANQLTLTGSPAAIESAKEIIESLNAPRQRRDRDDYY
ncbi:hypothetical protein JCM10212_003777 [Sporobolomyces blumeae]